MSVASIDTGSDRSALCRSRHQHQPRSGLLGRPGRWRAYHDPNCDERQHILQYKPHDLLSVRAERHPDTDFVCPLRDRKAQKTVHADRGNGEP